MGEVVFGKACWLLWVCISIPAHPAFCSRACDTSG